MCITFPQRRVLFFGKIDDRLVDREIEFLGRPQKLFLPPDQFLTFPATHGPSPRLIPPLVTITTDESTMDTPEADAAIALIQKIESDIQEAKDNLLAAKVTQAEFANRHRANEDIFTIGDKVMLSMEHRRREYMQSSSN